MRGNGKIRKQSSCQLHFAIAYTDYLRRLAKGFPETSRGDSSRSLVSVVTGSLQVKTNLFQHLEETTENPSLCWRSPFSEIDFVPIPTILIILIGLWFLFRAFPLHTGWFAIKQLQVQSPSSENRWLKSWDFLFFLKYRLLLRTFSWFKCKWQRLRRLLPEPNVKSA